MGCRRRTIRTRLDGHTDDIISMAFCRNGRILASASRDLTVKLWNVAFGMERATLDLDHGAVWCVAFSTNGNTLASGGYAPTVKLWNIVESR